MGQKVHPKSLRILITDYWVSKWFAKGRQFAQYLKEDHEIRSLINDRLKNAAISKIEIERVASNVKINIHTARPGIVIGKRSKELEELKKAISEVVKREVAINIIEVRKPDLDAKLLAESVAFHIERRVNYRRAMKEALNRALRSRAKGVKIMVSGRLKGAEIARSEKYHVGRVPLHTLRADIDYGFAEALTKYGIIGVKVWIFKGEKLSRREKEEKLTIETTV
ncbi:MAG: 30S ribosomal protein S3 [Deltaproteobacteria bacterium]|nr:30S ribosomal protein S3 [Deltaproteobacteria bacterium]MCX7952529.1 30S ribosomal protein S3 [Deltaproteobacteria bacterium]